MKIRTDYVSNSSSCSFFIELDSQEAIDAFKQISSNFDEHDVEIASYRDIDAVCRWDPYDRSAYCDNGISQLVENLEVGDWVKCDSGEDHDINFMNRFDKMVAVVDSSPVKFKIYEDPDAHTTYYGAMEFPE